MNSLSWLIYLASLIPAVKFLCVLVGVALLVWCVIRNAAVAFHNSDNYSKKSYPPFKQWWYALPLFLVAALIPGEVTTRLIIASEFGERIVNSERVQGIVDPGLKYVEQWLKDQLKKEK